MIYTYTGSPFTTVINHGLDVGPRITAALIASGEGWITTGPFTETSQCALGCFYGTITVTQGSVTDWYLLGHFHNSGAHWQVLSTPLGDSAYGEFSWTFGMLWGQASGLAGTWAGESLALASTVAAVPLPGAALLFAMGIALLCWGYRWRQA